MKRKKPIYASRLKRKSLKPASGPSCAINKLYDAGPEGFAGGMITEKYVSLCGVSRATAYRELTALCEIGVLMRTGRGTRYGLKLPTADH
jgi:Fic family protein